MRSINLLRIALEAEMLHLRAYAKRQGLRVLWGVVAAIFAVSVLVIVDMLIWQIAHLYVTAIAATLILLAINVILTGLFISLAMRNKPSSEETEAAIVLRDALSAARGTLVFTAALPVGRTLWALRRRNRRRR